MSVDDLLNWKPGMPHPKGVDEPKDPVRERMLELKRLRDTAEPGKIYEVNMSVAEIAEASKRLAEEGRKATEPLSYETVLAELRRQADYEYIETGKCFVVGSPETEKRLRTIEGCADARVKIDSSLGPNGWLIVPMDDWDKWSERSFPAPSTPSPITRSALLDAIQVIKAIDLACLHKYDGNHYYVAPGDMRLARDYVIAALEMMLLKAS